MPDQVVQMFPDATAAGHAASRPAAAAAPLPFPSSSLLSTDQRFTPRRRRKTESAVNPPIHVSLEDPSSSLCRRSIVNRARTLTISAGATPGAILTESSSTRPRRRASPPPETPRAQQRSRGGTLSPRSSEGTATMLRADDPRDAGRAAALTNPSAGSSDSPSAPTTITTIPSPSPSSASTIVASHLPSASAISPVPRLPQSRFSFEYQYPLRKRALTSHLSSSVLNSDDTPADPDPTPTPQRSFLYDSPRRSVPNFHLSHLRDQTVLDSQPPSPRRALEKDSDAALPLDAHSTARVLSPNATKRRKSSLYAQQTIPDVNRTMPSSTVTYAQGRTLADERNRAVNGLDRYGQGDGNRTPVADDFRSKNEDVFLNIARSDSGRRESLGRSELRRSRFRMSGSGLRSSTSRVTEQTPSSPEQLRLNTYDSPLHSQNDSPSTPHSSVPYSYSASAHPLDDHGRSSTLAYASGSRSTIGLPRSRLSRTSPEPSPYSPESHLERRGSLHESRAYRHSTLSTIRSSRQPSSSEATERARYESDRSRQDGTESTLSTNAPSTVWDELEDLKSRIKKLELTGKLPPSSQEAISSASGERPRTATTTVTTVSSSPKRGRNSSLPSGEPDPNTSPSPVHPLLQSALTKSKEMLSSEVYAALEVTVTDALALSSLLGSSKAPSGGVSVINGYSPSDRQARRKADSVCRSLTELCLALSDEQLRRQPSSGLDETADEPQVNGHHDDDDTITPTLSYRRSTNQEPESLSRRQSTSRVTSRLEARRASMAQNGPPDTPSNNKSNELVSDGKLTQSPGSSAPSKRLSRLSTSLRTKRVHTDDDAVPDQSPQVRTIPRSMTDITNPTATYRASPRQRISHAYTVSQSIPDSSPDRNIRYSTPSQPSQLPQPRTPTLSQSAIPLRRSVLTPSFAPATSRANIQAGSRRYGLSPGIGSAALGGDGPTDDGMPTSPHQEPSQTRIIAHQSNWLRATRRSHRTGCEQTALGHGDLASGSGQWLCLRRQ
ncbi:hypothetical protein BO94DRAFT_589368 [Aspergillus sclerotioniger CBS 115572]|uniref:LPXTG-motif cell wall anchor domain protein n=1 Tax=Aspergillus sclerotioniger CBS 115572 TaxID=1450535 RepID=A0A317VLT6_9EURO|nr:hypothetical protein BO94DRAFT_589368 [Aspergillus sclerotioniger CBS 115572]PWY73832.1 hypothetical protein BO94DRAFT_589368 [Aspergillus sclerotioniger CBS 115572]